MEANAREREMVKKTEIGREELYVTSFE